MVHMIDERLDERRRTYAMARHHAWAGSVLLAVLLALRIFLETTELYIDNIIFLSIGIILICYILVALLLTYRYRSSIIEPDQIQIIKQDVTQELPRMPSKEQVKIEKKKAKNEYKLLKKQQNDKK